MCEHDSLCHKFAPTVTFPIGDHYEQFPLNHFIIFLNSVLIMDLNVHIEHIRLHEYMFTYILLCVGFLFLYLLIDWGCAMYFVQLELSPNLRPFL